MTTSITRSRSRRSESHKSRLRHYREIRPDEDSLTYTASQRGLYPNTGTFEWSDIHLKNFTGHANGERLVEIYCSKAAPCFDWTFEDINIIPNGTDRPDVNYVCNNIVMDWNNGLNECHPGEPGYQSEQFFYL